MNDPNGTLAAALVADRFASEDAARREWLDRELSRETPRPYGDGVCMRGHPLDGVRSGTGRRYCKTCHRLSVARIRAAQRTEGRGTK